MNRDGLKLRLQNHFENNNYFAQADFNASIQDGYDEVVALSGAVLSVATIPFVVDKTYYDMLTLLPDLVAVVAIFNTVTKRWLYSESHTKWRGVRSDWETVRGTPEFFCPISHRWVAIMKKPSATYGNMYVFYKAAAPTLDANTTIQLPADYLPALEDYGKKDLWEQAQEWTKAGLYFATYQQTLEQLITWVNSQRNPGRMPQLRDNIG